MRIESPFQFLASLLLVALLLPGAARAGTTEVFIDTAPPGMPVRVDGKALGLAPVLIELDDGEHLVRAGEGNAVAEARLSLPREDFVVVMLEPGDALVVGEPSTSSPPSHASKPALATATGSSPARPTATSAPPTSTPAATNPVDTGRTVPGAAEPSKSTESKALTKPRLVETEGRSIDDIFEDAEAVHASPSGARTTARTKDVTNETTGDDGSTGEGHAGLVSFPSRRAGDASTEPPVVVTPGPAELPPAALAPASPRRRSGVALAISSIAAAAALASAGVVYAYAGDDLWQPASRHRVVGVTYGDAQIANGAAITAQSAAGIALASFLWFLASSSGSSPAPAPVEP